MKQRILGIDTGTNSLGWAVVDRYDDNHYELVKQGVCIFQEGVKIEKGIETSKAADRTSHRALRRQYFRRRLRKIEVLRVLIKHALCPALSEEDLKLWHSRKIYPAKPEFMQWQRTSEELNPYSCRYTCLYSDLDLTLQSDRYTLGRAMYHLAQRRGFLSNRLDASGESKDDGKVKESIGQLGKDMEEMGCRYLGEYFYRLYSEHGNKVRIRSRYTDREQHYRAEFDAICERQNLPEDVRDELVRALYFQRPLKSQRQSVGKCTFEKNKPRVSDSHYAYEEYRMLQFINSIRVRMADDMYDTKRRPLNDEEVNKIKDLFFRKTKSNFYFEDIAKKIAGKGKYMSEGSDEAKPYVFNYRMSQSVSGCPTTAQLRDLFGDDWQAGIAEAYVHNTRKDGTPKTKEEMADDVWNVLFSFDSVEKLREFAHEKLQLDEEESKRFAKISLSRNYASLSLKAIRKILPFLRMGMLYSHAVFMANIPTLIGKERWEADKERILEKVGRIIDVPKEEGLGTRHTQEAAIKEWLSREYGVSEEFLGNLYHPSMIETYPDPKPNGDGVILLGSPRTNALRNPMAMRSLHQLRKVVNALILEGIIDHSTIVHIEYARELNNANQRAAILQR
ncbi:MAG: CRISPR-associated protein Csn1, partial [Bacteroidaceae bacterium]|nr:CRISPR-associated protein Csn1 [Bacteroidaceae bacterium]